MECKLPLEPTNGGKRWSGFPGMPYNFINSKIFTSLVKRKGSTIEVGGIFWNIRNADIPLINHHIPCHSIRYPGPERNLLSKSQLFWITSQIWCYTYRNTRQLSATLPFLLVTILKSKTDQLGTSFTLPIYLTIDDYSWKYVCIAYLSLLDKHSATTLWPSFNHKRKTISFTKKLSIGGISNIMKHRLLDCC